MITKNGISVIVPFFNAQAYIKECIESILHQGKVVKEVICINDGSTDHSREIISKMQKYDSRIIMTDRKHQGVSRARNEGIQKATAEYLMFVDADDYLTAKRLNKLYKTACSLQADILVFGGQTDDPLHSPDWIRRAFSPRNKKYLQDRTKNIFEERGVLPSACNKLYKRELIQNLQFPEQLSIAEDNVFQFFAFIQAKRVVLTAKRVYVYRMHTNSALNGINPDIKKEQHAQAIKIVKEYLMKTGKTELYKQEYSTWKASLSTELPRNKKGKFEAIQNYIKCYGMRSALEYGIGKYMIKEKRI